MRRADLLECKLTASAKSGNHRWPDPASFVRHCEAQAKEAKKATKQTDNPRYAAETEEYLDLARKFKGWTTDIKGRWVA